MTGMTTARVMKATGSAIKTSRQAADRNLPAHKERARDSQRSPDSSDTTVKDQPNVANAFLTTKRLARSLALSKRSTGKKNQLGSWLHKAPAVTTMSMMATAPANAAMSR